MPRRKQSRGARTSRQRASWKGQLSFGLVSFPVEAFNALDRKASDIHFHQLHAECHSRVHYQKVCPSHGEVPSSEIVSGYEYAKDKYVEVKPEELEALRSQSDRALRLDAFLKPDAIDPVYFDGRMYYLLPADKSSQEHYAVIVEAMEREDCYAVGHLLMSGKDQLALLRPLEGLLHMAMLNYDAEIRRPEKLAGALQKPHGIARQVRLAQTLIEEWTEDHFDFSKYEDLYRTNLENLIKSKLHDRPIPPPQEEEPTETTDLIDALRRSLGQARHQRHGHKTHSSRRSA